MTAAVVTPADTPAIRVHARAQLPTRHGQFEIVSFELADGSRLDDVALLAGSSSALAPGQTAEVRLHSECLTGDVFGSLRCDCGDQLAVAFERIAKQAEHGLGVLLYMRQEGRGIGIGPKVAAYALQDGGLDTVEANRHLGFDSDVRRYDLAAAMLEALGILRVVLHTNNPRKVEGLREHGIEVVRREPLVVPARDENRGYLDTKRRKLEHEL